MRIVQSRNRTGPAESIDAASPAALQFTNAPDPVLRNGTAP
jgi:hypothetical protein